MLMLPDLLLFVVFASTVTCTVPFLLPVVFEALEPEPSSLITLTLIQLADVVTRQLLVPMALML